MAYNSRWQRYISILGRSVASSYSRCRRDPDTRPQCPRMSTLGRLTAALGVAHNENTLALANMNFDFSLFRVDAPLEFRALGANLSAYRRQEAETGTPHRTARKLGALFEGVLPHVPELSRAYGRRVSEISSYQPYNWRGNAEGGPFAAHMGVDGTAI